MLGLLLVAPISYCLGRISLIGLADPTLEGRGSLRSGVGADFPDVTDVVDFSFARV